MSEFLRQLKDALGRTKDTTAVIQNTAVAELAEREPDPVETETAEPESESTQTSQTTPEPPPTPAAALPDRTSPNLAAAAELPPLSANLPLDVVRDLTGLPLELYEPYQDEHFHGGTYSASIGDENIYVTLRALHPSADDMAVWSLIDEHASSPPTPDTLGDISIWADGILYVGRGESIAQLFGSDTITPDQLRTLAVAILQETD